MHRHINTLIYMAVATLFVTKGKVVQKLPTFEILNTTLFVTSYQVNWEPNHERTSTWMRVVLTAPTQVAVQKKWNFEANFESMNLVQGNTYS